MDKEAIRELRHKLGLSQEGLARKLGVSVLTVRRWEKGSFRPSPLAMARIEKLAQKISSRGIKNEYGTNKKSD